MRGKIVTLEEWESIHAAIMQGENIPRIESNGYEVKTYLGSAIDCKHLNENKYYILQDETTEKYCSGFVELTSDWFPIEEI